VFQNVKNLKANPGPGRYDPKSTINAKGSYFNSKHKSSMATTWNPPSSKRFNQYEGMYAILILAQKSRNMPGPGMYSPKTSIPSDGNYFVSTFKSTMCRTFYHSDNKPLKSRDHSKIDQTNIFRGSRAWKLYCSLRVWNI
jgi:hypothetical protein